MSAGPTISTQILSPILQHMENKGWDAAPIAHGLGIDLAKLKNVDETMPLSQYVEFMETVAKAYKAPQFGLYAAQATKMEALGPIGFLFASAPTLQDAIEGLESFIRAIQGGTTNRLKISGDDAILEYQILGNSISPRRQDTEYSLAVNYEHLKNYLKSGFKLKEVRLEHQQVGSHATYSNYFGCDVFFEQSNNYLIFDKSMLSQANPSISKKLYPIISAHLQNIVAKKPSTESISVSVKDALTPEVLATGAKARDVAAKIGLTATTMARRLKADGTSYSSILKSRRTNMAKRLLAHSTIPISHVALQLGYSETASFTRAFKASSGMTPDQFRQS